MATFYGSLHSQTYDGRLRGVIVDSEQKYLAGVNVVVVGSSLGDVTDERGRFDIRRIPPGVYQVRASMIGFETENILDVRILPSGARELNFVLRETSIILDEIFVSARLLRQEQSDPRSSLRFMEPKNSKVLPGFGEDVLRSLVVLPGVTATSDFTSQLSIRGSGPDQNLIIMDDIEIFNPYRLYGFISMFNPETVTGISLITGGFPAKYGDRLSSVLDVTNKEGTRKEDLRGSLNTSITNLNMVLEGRTPGIEGSYLLSARRTYYDLIIGPIAKRYRLVDNDVAFPNFSDLQTKVVIGPFDGHRFILNGLRSRDGVDIVSGNDRFSPDSVDIYDATNHYVLGASYQYIPSDRFLAKTQVSYYQNDGTSEFGGAFLDPALNREKYQDSTTSSPTIRMFEVSGRSQYIFEKRSVKQEFIIRSSSHTIEFGGGLDLITTTLDFDFDLDPRLQAIIQQSGRSVISEVKESKDYYRWNLYLQDKIKIGKAFFIQPGLRFDYYDILSKSYISPRLNLSYGLDAITTLRAAYGRFYQSPGYEKAVDTRSTFTFLQKEFTRNLQAQRADHYVVGVDRWIDSQWRISADLYYKRFDDLIVAQMVQGTRFVTTLIPNTNPRYISSWITPALVAGDSVTNVPVNASWGESYGIEFLLEKSQLGSDDKFFGWASYALSWANRHQYGVWLPFDFDQRHTINLVGNYRFSPWLEFGAVWRFGTNFPYTPAQGIRPRILVINDNGIDKPMIQYDQSTGEVIFDINRGEKTNSGRKPVYHRLDVRATTRTRWWGLDWSIYLDIINLYNRQNVLSYRNTIDEDLQLKTEPTTMFPIIPTFGLSVRF